MKREIKIIIISSKCNSFAEKLLTLTSNNNKSLIHLTLSQIVKWKRRSNTGTYLQVFIFTSFYIYRFLYFTSFYIYRFLYLQVLIFTVFYNILIIGDNNLPFDFIFCRNTDPLLIGNLTSSPKSKFHESSYLNGSQNKDDSLSDRWYSSLWSLCSCISGTC